MENFRYQYEKYQVANLGNTSFRVVASGPCLTEKITFGIEGICRERYYLMPNLAVKLQLVNVNNKKQVLVFGTKGISLLSNSRVRLNYA
ncbi:hypothetical protein [Providencia hangzhouensis]|uniref:EcpB family pilus assembly chaperone n=1 Tax=Providencia hangzhouensis TaxID=3031799 RepID=UPI0034DD7C37